MTRYFRKGVEEYGVEVVVSVCAYDLILSGPLVYTVWQLCLLL